MSKSTAERKANERARRAALGLKRLPDIYAFIEDHAEIKALAAILFSRRMAEINNKSK